MKQPFNKAATTYQEQVELLKQRGMAFGDGDNREENAEAEAEARFYLEHLNYYRLSAYWLPFEADHGTHQIREGVCFNQVLDLYVFDRELRLLVLDAIERIEVSVRAHWAYQLAHNHGPHAHLDEALAKNKTYWEKDLADLTKEVDRSDEAFIKHMKAKYVESLPPVWAVCEVMSLGLLSKWYDNLIPMATRTAIANSYNLDQAVLGSWLHHLSTIRNIAAHHSRLWNRQFVKTPMIPRTKPLVLQNQLIPGSRKLYNTLTILLYWMDVIAPNHTWRSRTKEFLQQHDEKLRFMGFPKNWEQRPIWGGGTEADLKPEEVSTSEPM